MRNFLLIKHRNKPNEEGSLRESPCYATKFDARRTSSCQLRRCRRGTGTAPGMVCSRPCRRSRRRSRSAVAARPLAVRAQQGAKPVIGLLTSRGAGDAPHLLAAFRQGLKKAGFIENQ